MLSDDPALPLTQIVENVERVRDHVQGYDLQAFVRNQKTKDAVERCLDRIAEACCSLGGYLESNHPDVPWADLRAVAGLLRQPDQTEIDAVVWRWASDLDHVEAAARIELRKISAAE